MACAHKRNLIIWFHLTLVTSICVAEPQLDLPPLPQVSTQRNPYGIGISSTSSINPQGNQFDLNRNFQYSTGRPQGSATPGIYPVSSTPFSQINPDISNNGYPSLDYGNGRNPSSTLRPFDDRNRDDRIDTTNDANFRRNDPNFARNEPSYVGTNPYSFNGDSNTNSIDDRLNYASVQQVRDFLLRADDQASKECTNNVAAQWNFETDVNDVTQHAAVSIDTFLLFLIFLEANYILPYLCIN
ncbi:unnamed protein product [Euphydryas editha]|uniref:Uncharacterized protein n=1 Tax=Euphydryas editha TaxID=104508 RepID=A0AAU9V1S3_EUPED|nr:unnamed protein product [Euphydryas editha]